MRRTSPLRIILGVATFITTTAAALLALNLIVQSRSSVLIRVPTDVQQVALTDTQGADRSLADLRGDYILISFGYTHCPDVCPITLTDYRRVKRELSDTPAADRMQYAFISVDGARDTPELLDRYLSNFDPAFIGLTTTDDTELDTITGAFFINYIRNTQQGENYTVDHSPTMFLLNPRGNVIEQFSFGTPADEIAERILGQI